MEMGQRIQWFLWGLLNPIHATGSILATLSTVPCPTSHETSSGTFCSPKLADAFIIQEHASRNKTVLKWKLPSGGLKNQSKYF